MIIGELAKAGTLRFCALQDKAGGVNPRTLSARLDELEKNGIVNKKSFAEVPPRCDYALTAKGRALVPALKAMAAWSKKYT
jgi:DNA-binding HxlR family transcriptional regulator